jgi:methylenetetrahydrofolate dehydrogenase (NADP+)/methenyltetrahydrofolate cyclohydrolase
LPARLIDGTAIGRELRAQLIPRITDLKTRGVVPGLAVILVGEDPASQVYVRMKGKACEEAGIHSETVRLGAETAQPAVIDEID